VSHGNHCLMPPAVFPKLRYACAFICALIYFANAWGQVDASEIRHIRVLDTNNFFDVIDHNAVVFPPRAHSLLVLDQPTPGAATIFVVPNGGQPGHPKTLSVEISDPINITYEDRGDGQRLFLFEPESSELVITKPSRNPEIKEKDRFQTTEYGVVDPRGIAVDPKTGMLFILDVVGAKIVRVDAGPNRNSYEGAAAFSEGRISELSLQQTQGKQLRGLAYNHADGCLYVFSTNKQELYKITEDGELVRVAGFPQFGRIDIEGLVFAQTLDITDDPNRRHLYIASSGGPGGQVSEWSVTPCVPIAQ
jgi:hypothetical protein